MATRRLDKNHDWTFGQGLNNYALASEEVAQSVKCRLWSFRNDWFMKPAHGVPYFDLMGRNIDLQQIETELRNAVLETVGVKEINSYFADLNRETRALTVTIEYTDVYANKQTTTTKYGALDDRN